VDPAGGVGVVDVEELDVVAGPGQQGPLQGGGEADDAADDEGVGQVGDGVQVEAFEALGGEGEAGDVDLAGLAVEVGGGQHPRRPPVGDGLADLAGRDDLGAGHCSPPSGLNRFWTPKRSSASMAASSRMRAPVSASTRMATVVLTSWRRVRMPD